MTALAFAPQNELSWDITTTVFHVLAIAVCAWRFDIRRRKGILWWDDWLIALAAVFNVVTITTLWAGSKGYFVEDGVVYFNMTWLFTACYIIMWMSRIAMWLSLARVYSTGHKRRQVCLILAGVYVVLGILSLLLGSFACPNSAGGSRQRLDKCYANVPGKRSLLENVSLGVNVVNGVTDIVLVVIMGYYLSDMTLPRHEKRLVIFLGSGSILTVLSLIVVLTVVYGPFEQTVDRQIVTLGVTHLGAYVALISANASVVGTALYSRFVQRGERGHEKTSSGDPVTHHQAGTQAPPRTTRLGFSTQGGRTETSTVTYASGLTQISSHDDSDGTELYDIGSKSGHSALYSERFVDSKAPQMTA